MANKVHRWRLSNGLTVLYERRPGLPLVSGSLFFRTGSLWETTSEAGLANMTTELLIQGTRRRSAYAIADVVESMGATLGLQSGEDHAEGGFTAPEEHLPKIFDVMLDVLTEPSFAPKEIQKERESILADLASRQDTIFNRAYDTFNALFYGSHPYGRPADGVPATVKGFRRTDLQTWHREHIRPEGAVFSLISSRPVGEIEKLVERYFRSWKRRATPLQDWPAVTLDFPKAGKYQKLESTFEQGYLMVGVPAPVRRDPDALPLKILNTLLGGGMSSRLFLKLREEAGLAYEVSSFFANRPLPSQWIFYLGLPGEKIPTAHRLLNQLLVELQDKGPTPEEVKQAKQMIRGGFLMDHQTRRRQSWYRGWWEFQGRGWEYDTQYVTEIDAITLKQVRAVGQKLLAQPRVTVEVTPKS